MIETYDYCYAPPTGAIAIIIPLHRAEALCFVIRPRWGPARPYVIYPLQGCGDGGQPLYIGASPYAGLYTPYRGLGMGVSPPT